MRYSSAKAITTTMECCPQQYCWIDDGRRPGDYNLGVDVVLA